MNPWQDTNLSVVERAKALAHYAHDLIGQKRKYTGEPYWVHTDETAELIAPFYPDQPWVVAGMHLHDVVEDVTPLRPEINLELIANLFGIQVANFVNNLTDVYTKEAYPDLKRAERKRLERERIGRVIRESKDGKLVDLISNTASIVKYDPDFARVYLREKLELLPYLADANHVLLNRASMQTVEACHSIGIDIPTLSS